MSIPEEGTIVEGFGDEVILSAVALFMACITIIVFVFMKNQNSQATAPIDPASQTTVDSVRRTLSQHREGNANQFHQSRTNMVCPVCLDQISYAVETNCGHLFCGLCMITYWHTGHWISGLRCPVDRREVTLLLKCFTEEESQQPSEVKDQIEQEVNQYNRRFSGQPIPWMERLRDMPTLLYHCFWEFFSARGLVLVFRIRILVFVIAITAYFLSPLDLIPEAVFGILGLFDDALILFIMSIYLSFMYRRYVEANAHAAANETNQQQTHAGVGTNVGAGPETRQTPSHGGQATTTS